jgi:hypothetical protein
MANQLFKKGREGFAAGLIDWVGDDIRVVLVDHGVDTPNPATDQYLSDIAAGARVATSALLTGKTNVGGTCDADDLPFVAVTGASVGSLVVYQDTGSAATSRLIVLYDTVPELPYAPLGAGLTFRWDNGANKMFTL